MNCCVGLTGGIGSGKSTVAALFQKLGITVIDSDIISHHLTQPGGTAIVAIGQIFGDEFIDVSGALNRARMRQLVFSDPAAKCSLEAILHPLIRTQMLQQIAAADKSPYILLVIPLLFETSSFVDLVQHTLVVDCDETTQITRAMQRSGLNEQTVRAIMAAQVSRAERLRCANQVIHNDSDLDKLQQQVATLHRHYLINCPPANRK